MNEIQSLLAVIAHPDDESYRVGGTLSLLAKKGTQVWVLCATRGEMGILNLDPGEVGQIRQTELECACRALGINPPLFLDYQDGTLAEVDEEKAVGHVVQIIRQKRPQVLLTWPHSGLSGHPDHVAVSEWTEKAFRLAANPLAYPEYEGAPHEVDDLYHIVMPHSLAEVMKMPRLHTVPDEAVTLTVDVSEVWDSKMAAIQCHASQLGSSPITSDTLERQRLFLGKEFFQQMPIQKHS